uniref:Uncharacterized protein n=1 Tax=Romanomermis culicivorax TaxID=13658 RepID=A0A915J1L7_ROMCU
MIILQFYTKSLPMIQAYMDNTQRMYSIMTRSSHLLQKEPQIMDSQINDPTLDQTHQKLENQFSKFYWSSKK